MHCDSAGEHHIYIVHLHLVHLVDRHIRALTTLRQTSTPLFVQTLSIKRQFSWNGTKFGGGRIVNIQILFSFELDVSHDSVVCLFAQSFGKGFLLT